MQVLKGHVKSRYLRLAMDFSRFAYGELGDLGPAGSIKDFSSRLSNKAYLCSFDDVDVLAFRGSKEPLDFLIDIWAFPRKYGTGKCHAGFRRAHKSIWKKIFPFLRQDKPLIVCGHSLGGANAELSCDFLRDFKEVHMITFGKPNVYRNGQAPDFNHLATQLSVVNSSDTVARKPKFFYEPSQTQTMLYFDRDGDPSINPSDFYRKIDRKLLNGVKDHSMELYSNKLLKLLEKAA